MGDILYRSRQNAALDVKTYFTAYFNTQRLHSTLGHQTPVKYFPSA